MASPQMVIRIASSVEELKKNLAEGKASIEALGPSVDKMAANWTKRSTTLAQDARNIVAAIDKVGASTLTAGDAAYNLKKLDAAMAQLERTGQAVPPQMRATADALRSVATAAPSATSALLAHASAYVAGLATFETAKRVLGGFVDFLRSSVEEASKAEAGQRRLETAMKTAGVATAGNVAAFKALADEIQRTTTIEDNEVTSLIAMGLQLGVLPSQMDGAIKASANLAAGLGTDLETAMRMIVKANNESFTAFGKLGISIDEVRAKSEGLPYIFEQINKSTGGQAAAEIETYAGQVKQLAKAWISIKEAFGGVVLMGGYAGKAMGEVTLYLRGIESILEGEGFARLGLLLYGALPASGFGTTGLLAYFRTLGAAVPPAVKAADDGLTALNAQYKKLDAETDAIMEASDKRKVAREEAAKTRAKSEADRLLREFEQAEAHIAEVEAGVGQIGDAIWTWHRQIDEAGDAKGWAEAVQKAREVEFGAKGVSAEIWKWGHELAPETLVFFDSIGTSLKKGLLGTLQGFPALLQQALTGGGGVGGALSAGGSQVGSLLGSSLFKGISEHTTGLLGKLGPKVGGAIFDMLPGIGGAIGALVGPLLGKLGDKLFKVEGKKVNDLRDAYFAAAGGFESLHGKLIAAGDDAAWSRLWNATTIKEWESGVAAAEKAIANYNTELERTKEIQSEIDALQKEIVDLEAQLVPTWDTLSAAAQKYGINLDALGPKVNQLKITDAAKGIVDAFEMVVAAGGEAGVAADGLKDEINAIVADSRKFGTAIPSNMQPVIRKLIEMGLLTDENGEKITDLSSLKWGDPVKSEADKIKGAIDLLREALEKFTKELADLVNPSKTASDLVKQHWAKAPWDEWGQPTWPDVPGGASGGSGGGGGGSDHRTLNSFAAGTLGRYLDFGAGTPVTLHGRERVMTEAEGRGSAGAASTSDDGTPLQNNIVVDGEVFARVLTRVARRKGWKT